MKMKMARTNIEWVAQVSLLRPGCSVGPISQEKPRSQKRDLGHPLKVWRLQLDFLAERTRISHFALLARTTCPVFL
jgi:hypothetical protein